MSRPVPRIRAVAIAAAMCLVLAGVPFSAASTVDDVRDDLTSTRETLDKAESDLQETRREMGTVAEQVRAADAILSSLAADLVRLESQLAASEAEAAAAAERTESARADLQLLDAELAEAEAYLAEREQLLADRAVAAFMFGSVSYAEVVVEATSVADFVNTTYYLRNVLQADKAVIDDVTDLAGELAIARAEADRLREAVEADQRVAEDALAVMASLTAEQERVTALAARERANRESLLQKLEVHEAATEAQIAELAAESAALEEKLRNMRWRAGAPGDGTWVWPTTGQITSSYGYRTHPIYGSRRLHAGTDIGAGWGTSIVAANDGLVVAAYCSGGGYGCRIVIDHGGGIASLYAHQSSFAVAEGQVVSAGQVIGYIGSTGASTGPHLHFEIRRNGAPEDPMRHY